MQYHHRVTTCADLVNTRFLSQNAHVMIVFTKTDLKSVRSIRELQYMMRLDQIMSSCKQVITHTDFNIETKDNIQSVYDWCFKFCSTKTEVGPKLT